MSFSHAPLWCVRPKPEDDELLSSWLHRLAIANAINDHTFCRHMFGKLQVWNRDLDRSFPEYAIPVLAQWTGVSAARIQKMKLTYFAGRLSETVNIKGSSIWILPIGVYHRIRLRNGLQFCPACLSECATDAKWMWRMAWATCCIKHQQSLQNKCSYCESPYMPHRTAPGLFGRSCCCHCGRDLSLQKSIEEIQEEDLTFQYHLQEAILEGGTVIDGKLFLALPLFEGIRTLIRVILSSRWMAQWERSFGISIALSAQRKNKPQFEFETVATRRLLLRITWSLLQEWPDEFCRIVQQVQVPKWAFVREHSFAPYWLQQALDELPMQGAHNVSEDEIHTACKWIQAQKVRVSVSVVKQLLGIVEFPRNCKNWKNIIHSYSF